MIIFDTCQDRYITGEVYSVETTYGINSVTSKLIMTFVENAETGQFLFPIMLILKLLHLLMTSSIFEL
jgi:hypothetical protein